MNSYHQYLCHGLSWLAIYSISLGQAGLALAAPAPGRQILFNGRDLAGWRQPTGDWMTAAAVRLSPADDQKLSLEPGPGVLINGSQGRAVNLLTAAEFGDVEAHIEFCISKHSNSGIYFMGRYELQIYDSYGVARDKYPGIECGGIYPRWIDGKEHEGHTPRVNASRPPGEWQSFDVVFRAPRFDARGKKLQNAQFVKVIHNGQVIHENVEVTGPTRAAAFENREQATGPLMLQGDHGPVAFRNLWVIHAGARRREAAENQPAEKEARPGPAGPARRSTSLNERAVDLLADAHILALAKATLIDQKALQSKYLRVRTENGVVFLDGFVNKPAEEALARKKLSEISGVTKVVAKCVVWPGLGERPEYETRFSGPAGDALLSAKIRAALLKAVAESILPWEMSILAVEVYQGDARVFVVMSNPELTETIARLAKELKGVNNCQVHACPAAKE